MDLILIVFIITLLLLLIYLCNCLIQYEVGCQSYVLLFLKVLNTFILFSLTIKYSSLNLSCKYISFKN